MYHIEWHGMLFCDYIMGCNPEARILFEYGARCNNYDTYTEAREIADIYEVISGQKFNVADGVCYHNN